MGSKWVEVRDSLVDVLKVDEVTEAAKQQATSAILSEVLPAVENAADAFVTATREQSKTETGWNKWRDGIVLPLIISGVLYAMKTVLEKTVSNTAGAATMETSNAVTA